jgi:hypothetical protein
MSEADPWASLGALTARAWDVLEAREGAARFVTLATAGPEGPAARTVALRAADRAAWTVEMASDARTPKVAALAADPRAELLIWDAARQEQWRLGLDVTLIRADAGRWADIPAEARLVYGTDPAPGTPVPAPEVVTRAARVERFVAILGRVRHIDAVSLGHDPHRRARLARAGGTWLAP